MSETPRLSTAAEFGALRRELEDAGFPADEALSLVREAFGAQMHGSHGQFVVDIGAEPKAGSTVDLTIRVLLTDNGTDAFTVEGLRTSLGPAQPCAWSFRVERDDPAFVRIAKVDHA